MSGSLNPQIHLHIWTAWFLCVHKSVQTFYFLVQKEKLIYIKANVLFTLKEAGGKKKGETIVRSDN